MSILYTCILFLCDYLMVNLFIVVFGSLLVSLFRWRLRLANYFEPTLLDEPPFDELRNLL